jgi:hypothetical protein
MASGLNREALKKLVIKSKDQMWPTVTWQDTQLVVYYLGEDDDEVVIKETRGIDFNEFLFHLDCGGSIFVTTKPANGDLEDCGEEPALDRCGSLIGRKKTPQKKLPARLGF